MAFDLGLIENNFSDLLNQENAPLIELRKSLLEIEEFISTDDYPSLTIDERNRLQDLRKNLQSKIQQIEDNESSRSSQEQEDQSVLKHDERINNQSNSGRGPTELKGRDPQAELQMEEAEKNFYSGRYTEAIKLFDRVIHLEPNWERAKQHRAEAENYLRTGYIPPVALPSEAASAFGKAQSASRVGRFKDAMAFLSHAQEVLRDAGIQRWQEGLEFEQKIQENIDAENAYMEGINFLAQGRVDEAIERVETAARATGLPKYNDKARELHKVKETTRSIHENLSSLSFDATAALQAKADLDLLTAEYGDNPAFQKLRSRFENSVPRLIGPLKDQTRTLKVQAERASTIEEALYAARQAKTTLDQMRILGARDESLDRLQNEVDRLVSEVQKMENDLTLAISALESKKRWPVQAARISEAVRQRFPDDPEVSKLSRSLAPFFIKRSLLRAGIIILIILIIFLIGWWSVGRFRVYMLSLTPTPTATASTTPTPTDTPTQTATPSITPTQTLTFTPTPTPILGLAMRDVWARSGCYEGFTATGKIPSGGELIFLPTERRFDQFNRECVLVEYQTEGKSVIGWILLLDIGNPQPTATP
jgi:tetratricopeptide (TPR) repeat protein